MESSAKIFTMMVIILISVVVVLNSITIYSINLSLNNQNEILEDIQTITNEAKDGKLYVFLNETSLAFDYLQNLQNILSRLNQSAAAN